MIGLLFAMAFIAAGALTAWSQRRYLARYREVRGIDPFQAERIGPAPWLFFVLLPRISRDLYSAYSTVPRDPELERLRRTVQRWQRVAIAAWLLLMSTAIARLSGIA